MIFIINKSTIQEFEDIPATVKEERLKLYIRKAQELDLEPFLGSAFFYELLSQFDETGELKNDAPQRFKDLVNGVVYVDNHGHTIRYEGIKPTLVYFAFARFIESDAVHYTSTGPVTKQHDNADPVPLKEIVKLVQQQRSVANAHANKVEKFLRDKKSDFPLWRFNEKNKTARQPGPRIRSIDRTDFNYPGGGQYNSNYPNQDLLS